MRTLAQLGQEALILDWQCELQLFDDSYAPPTNLIVWADEWIAALDKPPTALVGLSVDARTVSDTRPYLQELAAVTSWLKVVPSFAAKTLEAINRSPSRSRLYMYLFHDIAMDERFDSIFQTQFADAWREYRKTVENDGEGWFYWDREYFRLVLETWMHEEAGS